METRSYLVSGAGSGIGKAIAHQIASSDSQSSIILLGRNFERIEKARYELPRSDAHRLIVADLKDRDKLSQGIREARLESYRLVQEALPALRASKHRYRHIVIISSILARLGVPKYSAYCASKAGLLGLTRSFAAELASERILVNAICPGWVDTEMANDGLADIAEASGSTVEEVYRTEMAKVPLGKMSAPAEIASLIHFLVSDCQSSITGQVLDINGGAYMA